MLQRLLGLLALVGLSWLLGRLFGGMRPTRPGSAGPQGAGGRRGRPAERQGAPMVRDRVCNTFLPRARALTERVGSEEHFFCSEACRERFLSRLERPERPSSRA